LEYSSKSSEVNCKIGKQLNPVFVEIEPTIINFLINYPTPYDTMENYSNHYANLLQLLQSDLWVLKMVSI
jgi:hypothetical protein